MNEIKCRGCNATLESAKDNVLFSICGDIMAIDDVGEGGLIGSNIADDLHIEKWEQKRDGLVAVSKDMTLRIHKMIYCKECLCFAINRAT